jgi:hypothetical protein
LNLRIRQREFEHGAKPYPIALLDRHRRKGQQTVTVEHVHVHVHDGGQAIVGAVVGDRSV